MTDESELRWFHYRDRWFHYRDDDDWVTSDDPDDAIEEYVSHYLDRGDEIPKTITIYEFATDGTPAVDDDGREGYELHVVEKHKVDLHEWMQREEPDMIEVGTDGIARVPR